MAKTIEVSDNNFELLVLKAAKPVLVDFWAPWCRPCQMLAPTIETLAEEYSNRLLVAKLNVNENPKVASQYNILSIPTLLLFKNGKPDFQIVGFRSKEELKEALNSALR